MQFKYHFEKIIERCNAKLNLIRILASFNKNISCDKLITKHKAYVISIIQYSIIPFIYLKENAIKKIENLQNEALRKIFHCTKFISSTKLRQLVHVKTTRTVMINLFTRLCARQSKSSSFSEIYSKMLTEATPQVIVKQTQTNTCHHQPQYYNMLFCVSNKITVFYLFIYFFYQKNLLFILYNRGYFFFCTNTFSYFRSYCKKHF